MTEEADPIPALSQTHFSRFMGTSRSVPSPVILRIVQDKQSFQTIDKLLLTRRFVQKQCSTKNAEKIIRRLPCSYSLWFPKSVVPALVLKSRIASAFLAISVTSG